MAQKKCLILVFTFGLLINKGRMTFTNERSLYSSTCGLCKKNIITMYHPSAPFPVYCRTCWWGDEWDPLSFGQHYDFSRPFFEQFHKLKNKVPRCNLVQEGVMEGSERCYGCSDCLQMYTSLFCKESQNCTDSMFLYDCCGCLNCFGCVGLRRGTFSILNKQYTEDEYSALIPKIMKHMDDMPYRDSRCCEYRFGAGFPSGLSPMCYNETCFNATRNNPRGGLLRGMLPGGNSIIFCSAVTSEITLTKCRNMIQSSYMIITARMTEKLEELASRYHLSLVVIFGSQSTGKTHPGSDIDIAFVSDRPLTVEEDVRLNYELTTIFGTDRVDTVNIHHAPPLLMKRIFDEGTPLYQKTGQEFFRYRIYAMRRFIEAQPLYTMRRNEQRATLQAPL